MNDRFINHVQSLKDEEVTFEVTRNSVGNFEFRKISSHEKLAELTGSEMLEKIKNLLGFEVLVSVDGKQFCAKTKIKDLIEVVAPMKIIATTMPNLSGFNEMFPEWEKESRPLAVYWVPSKEIFQAIMEGAVPDSEWKYLGFAESFD